MATVTRLPQSAPQALSSLERLPDEIMMHILHFIRPLEADPARPPPLWCLHALSMVRPQGHSKNREGLQTLACLSLCSKNLRRPSQSHLFRGVQMFNHPSRDGRYQPLSPNWLDPGPFRATTSLHLFYDPSVLLPTPQHMPNLRVIHLNSHVATESELEPPSSKDAVELAGHLSKFHSLETVQLDWFTGIFLRCFLSNCRPLNRLVLHMHDPALEADQGEHSVGQRTQVDVVDYRSATPGPGRDYLVLGSIDPEEMKELYYSSFPGDDLTLPQWLYDRDWSSIRLLNLNYSCPTFTYRVILPRSCLQGPCETIVLCHDSTSSTSLERQKWALVDAVTSLRILAPDVRYLQIVPFPVRDSPLVSAIYHLASIDQLPVYAVCFSLGRLSCPAPHPLGSLSHRCPACKVICHKTSPNPVVPEQSSPSPAEVTASESEEQSTRNASLRQDSTVDGELRLVCQLARLLRDKGKQLACGGLIHRQ